MHDFVFSLIKKNKFRAIIILIALFIVDCIFLFSFLHDREKISTIYFFDVGQADAEAVVFDSGETILIDSGNSDGRILNALVGALPPGARTIDIVFISHPEVDHMGGLRSLIDAYQIGIVAYSGRETDGEIWKQTKEELKTRNIPIIALEQDDKVIIDDALFDVLSPNASLLKNRETNETSLVLRLSERGTRILFTGDVGKSAEMFLKNSKNVFADVLKVAHHGSKYSSSDQFLSAVDPRIAIIEVGKNSYGHPTQEALSRISKVGAEIFRTDIDGTVSLELLGEGKISIFKGKSH